MKARILIVEDEPLLAMMYSKNLEIHDFQVEGIASTGEEAVRLANETNPELILMDIILDGKMDGIEAARQICSKYNIPHIYITGNNDEMTRKRAMETSPLHYITKPLDIDYLIELLKK